MHHVANPLPPIRSKAQLIVYLREAAILEHQFMCQYLYACFSLKKDPDRTCSDAQFEHVRRWASTIYMIARQEMEHLSVVNSILTAVGGMPYYGHLGRFPTQTRWYTSEALTAKRTADMPPPCDIPFHLERFSVVTARRYACMESPHLAWVTDRDRETLLAWCFQQPDGQCPSIGADAEVPVARSLLAELAPPSPAQAAPAEVELGTIQDMYEAVREGLIYLEATLGAPALWSGHCSGQSNIPSEYNIYLFPICDLATALAGIKLVTSQGEGLDAPPGADSHYQLFVDIARDYEALLAADPRFEASLPLPLDPTVDGYRDPTTAQASEAFHVGYHALLLMLTGYYQLYTQAQWSTSPYLLKALEQNAFAPVMTMLVRSLAEVMAGLPANDGGPAGVSFDLTEAELAELADAASPRYRDIGTYLRPLDTVTRMLADLLSKPMPEPLRPKLAFIVENMTRVVRNVVYNYQRGIYPRFDPNNPAINCTPSTGCDCE